MKSVWRDALLWGAELNRCWDWVHRGKHEILRSGVEKKRNTTQAVKTLPASIKENRIPRAEAPCILFTKTNKKEVNGDQEGY
eukprot:241345-Pelagomonas_calceolata.AAC.1